MLKIVEVHLCSEALECIESGSVVVQEVYEKFFLLMKVREEKPHSPIATKLVKSFA